MTIVRPSTIGRQIRGINESLRQNQIVLGNRLLGIDEEWHNIGTASEPSFNNGWQQYPGTQDVGFYKDTEGKVHIRGTMRTNPIGSAPAGLNVFQLPAGYRPLKIENPQVMQIARVAGTGVAHFIWYGTFEIRPDGWCVMANGWEYSSAHLDDIQFWTK